MVTSIISPRLLAALPAFYPSLAAIQTAAASRDSYGAESLSWVTVAGLEALACRIAPAGGRESKLPDHTIVVGSHTVSLAGSYPTITPRMRVVIGALTLDILSVEQDGCGITTRLQCQLVVSP